MALISKFLFWRIKAYFWFTGWYFLSQKLVTLDLDSLLHFLSQLLVILVLLLSPLLVWSFRLFLWWIFLGFPWVVWWLNLLPFLIHSFEILLSINPGAEAVITREVPGLLFLLIPEGGAGVPPLVLLFPLNFFGFSLCSPNFEIFPLFIIV